MIALVWFKTHTEQHADGFLLADRKVGLWQGAFSIAVSWVWAPAIFVASMQAFSQGLAGVFWFTLPNVLCFFLFAFLAVHLRKQMPNGYTLPEFIHQHFNGHKGVHILYILVFLMQMLLALIINAYAGGLLLSTVSGLPLSVAVISMAGVAMAYSLISGLKASIFTDVIQMLLLLFLAFIIVPLCIHQAGGWSSVTGNLGGVSGTYANVFNPHIAFAMGIPLSISLMVQPLSDQMFIQRAMAVPRRNIIKTFVFGGLLFGLVPITLSLLGFVGVGLANQGTVNVTDPQMIAPQTIAALLPKAALYAFCLMAMAGLSSTIDSAYCAISALTSIDIYKRYLVPNATDKQLLTSSRLFMLAFGILGTTIALLEPKLIWSITISASITGALFFPTVFALFWNKVTPRGIWLSVALVLFTILPLAVYANVTNNEKLIVTASILSVLIGLTVCLIDGWVNKRQKPTS